MKRILPSAVLASLLLLSGCGSDSSSSVATSSTVKVERGPILGAVVIDDNGQEATQVNDTTASYTFETPPVYPITAYGGYIDVNRNGIIDEGEVKNTIILKAESGEVLTLLTSILTTSSDDTDSFFLDDLGLNSALTPTEAIDVAALSDVVYQYLIDNNLASVDSIDAPTMEQLKVLIELKIAEYEASGMTSAELEAALILKLEMEKLDDDDADDANDDISGQEHAADVIANLPNMSDDQKAHVIDKILSNSGHDDEDESEEENESEEEEENEDEEESEEENESDDEKEDESEDDDKDKK